MEIERRVFAPIKTDGHLHREASQAIEIAKIAATTGLDRGQFMQFLLDHMELEQQKALLYKRHGKSTYHPNSVVAAQIRSEAYRTMIDRMLE